MAKEHFEREDITKEELKEIKELYDDAKYHLNGLTDIDDVESVCNHISGYDLLIDTLSEAEYLDIYTVSIGTDNTAPFTLQGLRVYIDKQTGELSPYIDVYFNEEEYPFEDFKVTP